MGESGSDGARLIAGRYRLGTQLGRGGMGVVWAAHDEVLDRDVAVKELLPSLDLPPEQRELVKQRTRREARAAARIEHPAAVTVYDVVEQDDHPWIVMQLLRARTLAEVLAQDGPLQPAQAVGVGLDVLDALRAAHRAGVLHRDVKPSNVMVTETGAGVLTDFGIATVEGDATLTTTGMLIGSPGYMSPEQARGERPTTASDLWSLGATLYAAVEGASPFRRDGQLPTLNAVLTTPPPPAPHAGPLGPVLLRLLTKDPDERPDAEQTRALLLGVHSALEREAEPTVEGVVGPTARMDVEPTVSYRPPPPVPQMLPVSKPRLPAPAPEAPQPGTKTEPAPEPVTSAPTAPVVPRPGASEPVTPEPVTPEPVPSEPGTSGPTAPLVPRPPVTSEPGPSEPDAPGRTPAPTAARRSRRGRAALAAALVLAVLAGVLIWTGLRSDDRDAGRGAAAGPTSTPRVSATAPATAAATSTASSTPATSAPATSSPAAPTAKASATAGSAVPVGFRTYKDPTGFSLAVPEGWTRSKRGSSVYFRQPGGRSYLQIDQTTQPKADVLRDWQRQASGASARFSGYRLVRLERVDYGSWDAADWEFTWRPSGGQLHVLNRNVRVSDRRAYALLWSVPAAQWDDRRSDFTVIARTFDPAS